MRARSIAFVVVVSACGRIGFDPTGGGDDTVIPGATRLDLAVGRHDPAGYNDAVGTAARFSHPRALVTDGQFLYVADSNTATIRKLDPATGAVTTVAGTAWHSGEVDGVGTAAQFHWPIGITWLNGTLYVADEAGAVIRSVDVATGTVETVAGMAYVQGTVDGAALGMATFYSPWSITNDGTYLYVLDSLENLVRRIDLSAGQVAFFAGGTDGAMDGSGAAAQFHYPTTITYAGTQLYVGDTYNRAVRTIDPASAHVQTIANTDDGTLQALAATTDHVYYANVNAIDAYDDVQATTSLVSGSRWSFGTMDGNATTALFRSPQGLAVVGTKLYMTDTDNSSIRAIDLTTGDTTTIAGGLEPTSGPVDGVGSAARFDQLNGITTDGTRIWVTDENNYTIREIDPMTQVSKLIAGQSMQYGTTDGIDTALFHRPAGITYADGMLYVVDRDSHRLRSIDPTTHQVTTIGNPMDYDSPGDVLYANGVLYVADEGGERILSVDPATGAVTPLAGMRGMAGEVDGIGTAAQFYDPRGLSMCGGMLYVADRSTGAIRRVDPTTGAVTTWVKGSPDPSDGPVATARFAKPMGTTCDADALYVADAGANALRRIDFATQIVTTVVGSFWRGEDHDDELALAATNAPLGVRIVGGRIYVMNASNLRVIH